MSAAVKLEAPWSIPIDAELYREISWYFLASSSELGLKSGFGSLLARSKPPRTTAGGPLIDDGEHVVGESPLHAFVTPWDRDEDNRDIFDRLNEKIDAIGKHRRIRAGLRDLSQRHMSVLCTMFEERTWPNALVQTFGEAAGLAVASDVAKTAYKEASGRKKARLVGVRDWLDNYCRHQAKTEEGKAMVETIRSSMRRAVLEAFAEYSQVRRVVRRPR